MERRENIVSDMQSSSAIDIEIPCDLHLELTCICKLMD